MVFVVFFFCRREKLTTVAPSEVTLVVSLGEEKESGCAFSLMVWWDGLGHVLPDSVYMEVEIVAEKGGRGGWGGEK
jgi:hypothetical protein